MGEMAASSRLSFHLFEQVRLCQDFPDLALKAGDIGAVVEIYNTPAEAYEVEFVDVDGNTFGLHVFHPWQLLKVAQDSE